MKSLGMKIKQISALPGTGDVSDWESNFIDSIVEQSKNGEVTTSLTEKQVIKIEAIWSKHYA